MVANNDGGIEAELITSDDIALIFHEQTDAHLPEGVGEANDLSEQDPVPEKKKQNRSTNRQYPSKKRWAEPRHISKKKSLTVLQYKNHIMIDKERN